jgi:multidrug efflux system outer membrane protein
MVQSVRALCSSAATAATLAWCGLGLTGCTVGPDFQPPATTMPAGWSALAVPSTQPGWSSVNATAAELSQWWRVFGDDQLTSLVDRALTANLDLRQAAARIRQARAARAAAGAPQAPTVNSSGSYTRSGPDRELPGSHYDSYRVGLDASWELDLFGGTRRSIEAADADLLASIEDQRAVQVSLAAEVAAAWIDLRGLQRQIAIARQNLELQEKTLELTRQRMRAGRDNGLDVASAESQVAQTRAQIPPLVQAARSRAFSLAVLLGLTPGSLDDELTAVVDRGVPHTPATTPIGAPSELLRRRPDIRRAEAQLHAATARIGVATAQLFPQMTLTGSLGFQGFNPATLANWESRVWSVGPQVRWNIFDGGRIRANIAAQGAAAEAALIAYQKVVLNALAEVETALVALEQDQLRRVQLALSAEAAQRALDLAEQRYTAGFTDFIRVLDAQRSLLSAQNALVQSDRAVAADLVALYKALGGGWDPEPMEPAAPTTQPGE